MRSNRIRYPNEGLVSRLMQWNCEDLRMVAHGLCTVRVILWIPFHVMLQLAQSVPQNGHVTANMAVLPWQFDSASPLSRLISRPLNKFRPQKQTASWQSRCIIPFVGDVMPLETPTEMTAERERFET